MPSSPEASKPLHQKHRESTPRYLCGSTEQTRLRSTGSSRSWERERDQSTLRIPCLILFCPLRPVSSYSSSTRLRNYRLSPRHSNQPPATSNAAIDTAEIGPVYPTAEAPLSAFQIPVGYEETGKSIFPPTHAWPLTSISIIVLAIAISIRLTYRNTAILTGSTLHQDRVP